MGVTDFDTKVAVVVRDDLATWQRLNVTAFLMSGIVADAGTTAIGEPYRDADAREYLPLLVQPVLVFIASGDKLRALRERGTRGCDQRPRPRRARTSRPAPRRRRGSARSKAPPLTGESGCHRRPG